MLHADIVPSASEVPFKFQFEHWVSRETFNCLDLLMLVESNVKGGIVEAEIYRMTLGSCVSHICPKRGNAIFFKGSRGKGWAKIWSLWVWDSNFFLLLV